MKARIIALMAATSGVTAAHASTCSLIVLDSTDLTQVGEVINFASATAVANYYGSHIESGIASSFFSDNEGCSSPRISFTRFPVTAARAHLYGGNLTGITPQGSGQVSVTSQGYIWTSATITLTGTIWKDTANLQTAINSALPTAATFSGSLAPASCQFQGYVSYITLNVTNMGSCTGGVPLGAQICDGQFTGSNLGSSCSGGQIASHQQNMVNSASYKNNATTQNPAKMPNAQTLSLFLQQPIKITTNENITAYYETLTVAMPGSGTIAVGQQITDASGNTCVIWSGSGRSWTVSCKNPTEVISNQMMTTTPSSMEIINTHLSSTDNYLEMSANDYCPFFATTIESLVDIGGGDVAAQLLLSTGYPSQSEIITNVSDAMDDLAGKTTFDSFTTNYIVKATSSTNYKGGPGMPYGELADLLSWSTGATGRPVYYGWK